MIRSPDFFAAMIDAKLEIRTFIVEHFLFGQAAGLADDTSFLEQAVID